MKECMVKSQKVLLQILKNNKGFINGLFSILDDATLWVAVSDRFIKC